MANTVLGTHGSGIHSARPAGNAVPDGSLYSCSTHSLIYVSSYGGNSWATWATLTGTGLADPMTTRGDIIVRDSSNTTARLAKGATANMALRSDGTDVGYALIPGTLIAIQKYAPTQTIYSTASTTFADLDSTNMAVTFTAPASGNVLIHLSAYHDMSAGSGSYAWCLRESSSILADSVCFVNRDGNSVGSMTAPVMIYLTGVSAGAHTYKWGHAVVAGSGPTGRTIVGPGDAGGDFGAGIMAVFAA